jgi:hypothetical protein
MPGFKASMQNAIAVRANFCKSLPSFCRDPHRAAPAVNFELQTDEGSSVTLDTRFLLQEKHFKLINAQKALQRIGSFTNKTESKANRQLVAILAEQSGNLALLWSTDDTQSLYHLQCLTTALGEFDHVAPKKEQPTCEAGLPVFSDRTLFKLSRW